MTGKFNKNIIVVLLLTGMVNLFAGTTIVFAAKEPVTAKTITENSETTTETSDQTKDSNTAVPVKEESVKLATQLVKSVVETLKGKTVESTSQSVEKAASASGTFVDPATGTISRPDAQDPLAFLKGFQGNYETDLFTGAASYAYSFWVPQGRGNTTPNVALSYSSTNSRGDVDVAYGWNLTQNAIYRTSNKGLDQLYSSNEYAIELNGGYTELAAINLATGKFGAKYSNNVSDYTFSNNSWIVRTTDGTKYYFGTQSQSKQVDPADSNRVYKWLLEKVEDTNGNTATYTYFQDGARVYPAKIRYSGHNSEEGIYEIVFNRTSNAYPKTSYLSGFKVTTNYLINKIDVNFYQENVPVLIRSYNLEKTFGNNALPKLSEISVQSAIATDSILPLKFSYYDGSEGNGNHAAVGLLKKIEYPAGASQELVYKKSTAYKYANDGLANAKLPFTIDTVYQSIAKVSANAQALTTTYSYSGGHYYFDPTDAYKREYAGFHEVDATDPQGNVEKLFFHQSEFAADNADSSLQGEYQDHISKKGHSYREEKYDNANNLKAVSWKKWDKLSLPKDPSAKDRYFIFLSSETNALYDSATPVVTAKDYSYDSYGNVITINDYGKVALSDNTGAFTDSENDKITSTIQYAVNATNFIYNKSSVQESRDFANNIISHNETFYDGLLLNQVEKGNTTKATKLAESSGKTIVTQIDYDDYGLPVTYYSPLNYETQIVYDQFHLFPAQITNAKNQSMTYVYNYGYGQPISATMPNGAKTEYVYDGLGRLVEKWVSDPQNASNTIKTASTVYDTVNYPNSVQQTVFAGSLSQTSITYFDGFARAIQSKSQAGDNRYTVKNTIYNELGQVQKNTLPIFTTTASFEAVNSQATGTTYTYDALGRALTQTDSLGTSSITYNGLEKTITDRNGKYKKLILDARGNLVRVVEYLDGIALNTNYTYDSSGNLVGVQDSKGNVRAFSYDLLGRKISEEELHDVASTTFGIWHYSYNDDNKLIWQKDAKNQEVQYSYDELDRVTAEDYLGSTGTEISYGYDEAPNGIGKLTSVETAAIDKHFVYDLLGRVVTEQKTIEGRIYETGFTYDLLGNVLSVTDPAGVITNNTYGTGLLLVSTAASNGSTLNATLVSNLDYSPLLGVTHIQYGNGVTTDNTYDPSKLYRLTSKVTGKNTTQLQNFAYSMDTEGNMLAMTNTTGAVGSFSANYSYDDLYRLTQATVSDVIGDGSEGAQGGVQEEGATNGGNYTQSYSYDEIGNILNKSDVGDYTYTGVNPHAVTSAGDKTYTYDANGNMQGNGTWTYTWDYRNRLVQATNGTRVQYYSYDESGERVTKKQVDENGVLVGVETIYPNKYLVEEWSPTTSGIAVLTHQESNLYVGSQMVATYSPVITQEGGIELIEELNATPEAGALSATVGTLMYHHGDNLSGTNVDTNEQGEMIEAIDYQPFGSVHLSTNSGEYDNRYKYTGKEQDEDTGLYYYGARYYNSDLGRFVSVDPWGGDMTNPQTLNKYSYVVNNPMRYTDPSGKCLEDACAMEAYMTYTVITTAVTYFYLQSLPDIAVPTYVPSAVSPSPTIIDAPAKPEPMGPTVIPQNNPNLSDVMVFTPSYSGTGLGGLSTPTADPLGSSTTAMPGLGLQKSGCGVNMSCASRPNYGKGQVDQVWDNAKDPSGNVYDPHTGEKLNWDKSKSRSGQWDMGHIEGEEYRKLEQKYKNGEISREEFLNKYRDPANYQPESPSSNRSRIHEQK